MDKDYCYIDDALGKEFEPSKYKSNTSYKYLSKNKIYRDADSNSKKLYNDLADVYKNIGIEHIKNKKKLNYKKISLSSDYIGPSRYWASECGLYDLEIGTYLKKVRKLGGHIIWPTFGRYEKTINTARGGAKGYYDRIDCTLYELKLWYENKDNGKLKDVFDKSKDWLNCFNNFSDFIDKMDLKMYADKNNNVYDLTTYDDGKMKLLEEKVLTSPKIISKDAYERYVDASIDLIDERTELMIKRANK